MFSAMLYGIMIVLLLVVPHRQTTRLSSAAFAWETCQIARPVAPTTPRDMWSEYIHMKRGHWIFHSTSETSLSLGREGTIEEQDQRSHELARPAGITFPLHQYGCIQYVMECNFSPLLFHKVSFELWFWNLGGFFVIDGLLNFQKMTGLLCKKRVPSGLHKRTQARKWYPFDGTYPSAKFHC